MKRLLPASLFGQTVLIVLFGLVLSQFVGVWIYSADREEAVRVVGGMAAAQRVANLVRLLEESPPESRRRMVDVLDEPGFHVSLSDNAPNVPAADIDNPAASAIKAYLSEELTLRESAGVLVALSGVPLSSRGTASGSSTQPAISDLNEMRPGMGRGMGMGLGRGRMAHAMTLASGRPLSIGVRLSDGRWLVFATGIADQTPARSWWFFASLAVMAMTVLIASAWAVHRVIAPLGMLGDAAERFSRDVATAPLAERGPIEMRRAAHAFNEMQFSLRRLIENRSRLLAAVSHDLRTPLTLLRLRAETVDDGENRDRMLASIADMEAMLAASLDFARDAGKAEPRRPTDLTALLASIIDDMADAGLAVTMAPAVPVVSIVQPAALKRALTNLIDNAIKYGKAAHVEIEKVEGRIAIAIDDEGPGIPEEALGQVFEPFFRLDEARSSETGGSGLGLSIAQSVVHNHGGTILLSNRPGGGLRAVVTLTG